MKKYGKEVIANYEKIIGGELFECYVINEDRLCGDGNKYYNVHIISDGFKDDEMNTLKLQEPHNCIDNPKEYFNKKYMIARIMEHFIWDRFYDEGILNVGVEIYGIDEH